MSAKGSCPDEQPCVGDRQVDTLTSYTLRSTVGTAQPRSDSWVRLRTRVQTGSAVPVIPEVRMLVRFWHTLMAAAPRLTSAGAALAMLALFIHSSLVPLTPTALNDNLTPISNVPEIKAAMMDHYLATQGASPAPVIPVFKVNEIPHPYMVSGKPPVVNVPDPRPNLYPSIVPAADTPDPVVHMRFAQAQGTRDNFQADPLPHN
jgi:hypothetical protein